MEDVNKWGEYARAKLMLEVEAALQGLGLGDEIGKHYPNLTPNLAMLACMRAARDVMDALSQNLRREFWDGGDDIDYTDAAGDLIHILTTALSADCDDDRCTLLLNFLATIPDDSNWTDAQLDAYTGDENEGRREDDSGPPGNWNRYQLSQIIQVAGSGGYSSPIIERVMSLGS